MHKLLHTLFSGAYPSRRFYVKRSMVASGIIGEMFPILLRTFPKAPIPRFLPSTYWPILTGACSITDNEEKVVACCFLGCWSHAIRR